MNRLLIFLQVVVLLVPSYSFSEVLLENKLLATLPSSENIRYEGVTINQRYISVLKQCSEGKIESEINRARPSLVKFYFSCHSGKTFTFSAELVGKARSLVVKDSIKRKTKLNSQNTSLEWVELDILRAEPLLMLPNNYYQTTRNLRKGQNVYLKDIDVAPVIDRGRKVKAVFIHSNITVEVEVTALEDGTLGDTIKVENSSSNRIFFGEIIDASTVVI